jgi:hypothetical protein
MKDQLHGAQIRRVCEIDWAGVRKAIDIAMGVLRNDNLGDGVIEVVTLSPETPSDSDSSLQRMIAPWLL